MRKERFWLLVIPLVSVLILLFLFLPGLGESFFGIDDAQLFNQSYLRNPWDWQSFVTLMTPGSSPDYYPVRDLSVWFDWTIAENLAVNTTVAKVQNLFWLMGSWILFFFILETITRNRLFSLIVASAWMLHSFHLESLHWISARKDLMSWFFILSATTVTMSQIQRGRVSKCGTVAILGLFLLSLLSKATFIALPFSLALWLFWLKKSDQKLYERFKPSLLLFVIASGISVVFVFVTYWVYASNNNMQMAESPFIRGLSVMAALGRNICGIFLPGVNGVDVEPWGGWYRYNERFIVVGCISLVLYAILSIFAVFKKKNFLVLFCLLIGAILGLTPGFNPLHRNYYSVRYFEPIFFIAIAGSALALVRTSKALIVSSVVWVLFVVTAIQDSGHWNRNINILKKAHAISLDDPSPASMLVTEYYNLDVLKKLTSEESAEFSGLLEDVLKACVESSELNGRCLSFYNHVRYLLDNRRFDIQRRNEILKTALERMVSLKRTLFTSVAEAEIARTIFNYHLYVEGRLDVESLRTYFKSRQNQYDGDSRIFKILYECLENGAVESQRLFAEGLSRNLVSIGQARQFIAGIEDVAAKKQVANCFIPSK